MSATHHDIATMSSEDPRSVTPTSAEKGTSNLVHHSTGPPHYPINQPAQQQHLQQHSHLHHGRQSDDDDRDRHHHLPIDRSVHAASGGALHPGLWHPYEHRKFANPAPLGLSAFALTTFVLSAVNLHTRGVAAPNIAVPLAFGYGGVVQLLAGMWEMAVGNTFGATALSSYGGFWISYAILLTPAWGIVDAKNGPYASDPSQISSVLGLFLTGWFIFTSVLLICTLRSTLAFFSLFFTLDLAFLFLACENFATNMGRTAAANGLRIAGGVFGMFAAFLAWYCALAGIQDDNNSFFRVPVYHFPWSAKVKEERRKSEREVA